jgi:hypothetical protein
MADNQIQAIETYYRGFRFRSRLEARWAVFFDHLKIKFDYEPEGYNLGGGLLYLPDFHLPGFKWWAEVKPEWFKSHEEDKAYAFAKQTGRSILLLDGPPNFQSYFGFQPVRDGTAVHIEPLDYSLDVAAHTKATAEGRLWGQPHFEEGVPPEEQFSPEYREAVYAARAARFEERSGRRMQRA